MWKKIKILISVPKSFWVNIHYFPLKEALKLPLLIAYNTRIGKLSSNAKIELGCPIGRGLFKLGFHSIDSLREKKKQYFSLLENAVLVLNGRSDFAEGSSFTVKGRLIIGDNVTANNNFRVSCHSKVVIGDGSLIGWDVKILDSDNHILVDKDGFEKVAEAPVIIGNKVWIGAFANFLKGSSIPDNCVVAYGSLVTRMFNNRDKVIGGSPAKEIGDISTWHK